MRSSGPTEESLLESALRYVMMRRQTGRVEGGGRGRDGDGEGVNGRGRQGSSLAGFPPSKEIL